MAPATASTPVRPEPGGRRSQVTSSNSTVLGVAVKAAVSPGSWPGRVMLMAYGPPSLAPIMSRMAIGWRLVSPRLLSALNVAPVETTRCTDDRS